jgi:hypothetical protein
MWDLATAKIRLRGRTPPQAALADGGRLLVDAGIEADNAVFRCRDVQTGALRLSVPLPDAWHFRVAPCGSNGRLVGVNMETRPSRLKQPGWAEKLLSRLSLSPRPSTVQSQEIVFDEDYGRALAGAFIPSGYQSTAKSHCMLLDTANGRSLLQTSGALRAVSDDGRYAITENANQLAWKLWELPSHRSVATILLAVLVWLLMVVGLTVTFRRRRVKLAIRPQIVGPKND